MAKSSAKLKLEPPEADPTAAPRQELAAALARVHEVEAAIAADEAAVSDASATIAEFRRKLAEAKERASEATVFERRKLAAELAELAGEVEDWTEHRKALGIRLNRSEKDNLFTQLERAKMSVRNAAAAVIQAHPGTLALLERQAAARKLSFDLGATLGAIGSVFGIPAGFEDWDSLPIDCQNQAPDPAWVAALEKLQADPETELPG